MFRFIPKVGGGLDVKLSLLIGEGEGEQEIFEGTIPFEYSIEWLAIQPKKGGGLQVRNARKAGGESSTCINTIGSFSCIDSSEEMVAIGTGGYTTSSSTRPTEISVVTPDGRFQQYRTL